MNKDLFLKLTELRNRLRQQSLNSGRTSVVCTDASLSEIARLEPKTREELSYISGLGSVFIEKYADEFLNVLHAFHARKIRQGILCPEVRATLKNLENRLVNINKRNRLLYMPKLSASYAYDLAQSSTSSAATNYNNKLVEFVKRFDPDKRLLICDATKSLAAEKQYKKLRSLLREASRVRRESGENDLYIAYPFVIGKMIGDNFPIRAPLALFPVEVIIQPTTVVIKMDTSKDVLFNSNLILSYNKFAGKTSAEIPSSTVEDVDFFRFIEQVQKFYESSGIKLLIPPTEIKPFKEYNSTEFPKFKSGEFHLEESVVLGKFSMYSSALQKDFKDIIESERINELLNDLLQRYEDVDFYADSQSPANKNFIPSNVERNISYINDLNISQESVIFNINTINKLVVQGPPGTGKSQTITSVIADFVNKGKNVLMVSQKKAALDVIYSRLGTLSKYCLLINDVKDKDYFYEQLFRILSTNIEGKYEINEFNGVSDNIDADLKRLDNLAEKLYYDKKYGVEMFRIYEDDINSQLNHGDIKTIELFTKNTPTALFDLGYPLICAASKKLADEQILKNGKEFYDLVEKFNWLHNVSGKISQMQITSLIKTADDIVDLYVAYKSKKMFARLSAKTRYKKALKEFVKNNFKDFDKRLLKNFTKDPLWLYNGLSCYTQFIQTRTKFDELSSDEKLFFGAVYNISQESDISISKSVMLMPQFAAYYYINEFEVENRDALSALENYDIILKDVLSNFTRKKLLSKECLKSMLTSVVHANILSSKRKGEMQRVIDGKRRWSINRFVSKFGFELFKGIKIWLLTPEVVSEILPLESGLFDLLIFDEASQIYIEKGVPSIARAKKVVIAGDHKQLRPSSLGTGRLEYDEDNDDGDESAAIEEESLLDLARFKYPEVLLNYHYRSKYEELIAFSNYAFYKGRLNVSPNVDKPASPPIQVHYTSDGKWEDRRNIAEAKKTLEILQNFFKTRKNNETVGVITFNVNQRDLIQDMLDELCASDAVFGDIYRKESNRYENGEDVGLFVKNIENVQGDERDCIIFSLAYAKDVSGKVVRNFGWLNQVGGENRLNVAISRAKRKIHIVTSVQPYELKVEDLTNEGPRILKKYLEYAYCISGGNVSGAKEVLSSFGGTPLLNQSEKRREDFVDTVFNRLIKEGFSIERDVGIGSYKIDLAIKSKSGKYVLGLECDSSLYPYSKPARERDIHRRVYLESRGWKILRIWSSNWWRNSSADVSKIKTLISSMN